MLRLISADKVAHDWIARTRRMTWKRQTVLLRTEENKHSTTKLKPLETCERLNGMLHIGS